MHNDTIEIATEILIAWRTGSTYIRRVIISGIVLSGIGISIIIFAHFTIFKDIFIRVGMVFLIPGLISIFGVYIHRKSLEAVNNDSRMEEIEERVKKFPNETQATWDLARIKLESYLNRNLSQVRSIYWLTVFVMIVGFGLVTFGVYTVIQTPEKVTAAIISSLSGVMINFIGATFLMLYKSTMTQATEYVSILERINAVGMSVQILNTLEDDHEKIKQKATAELSKQLLALYQKK